MSAANAKIVPQTSCRINLGNEPSTRFLTLFFGKRRPEMQVIAASAIFANRIRPIAGHISINAVSAFRNPILVSKNVGSVVEQT
jgi:hypothetical protein